MSSPRLLWLDDDKSAAGLFPCDHQADIRMCSHRLLWLDDNKSAAGLFSCSHQADIRMCSHRLLWLGDNKSADLSRLKKVVLATVNFYRFEGN